MATVQEQFDAFMKTPSSKNPHISILVEGFEQHKDSISFNHETGKITIPLKMVLFPKKKKLTEIDYIDNDKKTIWVFLKGTLIIDITNGVKSADCGLTCRMPISLPIITPIKKLEAVIPTYFVPS